MKRPGLVVDSLGEKKMRKLMVCAVVCAAVAAILLAMFACEGRPFVLEIDNGDTAIELESIEAGAIVSDEIEVVLKLRNNPGSEPEGLRLHWAVRSAQTAEVLLERSLELDSPYAAAKLTLPEELSPGLYVLEVTLYHDEQLVERHEREFFRSFGSYEFVRVSSYPAAFAPDSEGILVARIEHPGAAPPFVRVRFAGQDRTAIVKDGRFEVVLHSPKAEGVYVARFELFPVRPPAGRSDYDFDGPVVHNHKLIVKDRPVAELSSEDRRFSQFRLRGNLRDTGLRPKLSAESSERASVIGEPRLAVRDEVFGYWLEAGDGFEVSDFLLPMQDGVVHAFTLAFGIYLPEDQRDRHVFSTVVDAERPIGVTISIGQEGRLVLSLFSGDESVTVESDERVFAAGVSSRVRVTVQPQPEGTAVRVSDRRGVRFEQIITGFGAEEWKPGAFKRRDIRDEASGRLQSVAAGRTVVGGDDGFYGIIESFSASAGGLVADSSGRSDVY